MEWEKSRSIFCDVIFVKNYVVLGLPLCYLRSVLSNIEYYRVQNDSKEAFLDIRVVVSGYQLRETWLSKK